MVTGAEGFDFLDGLRHKLMAFFELRIFFLPWPGTPRRVLGSLYSLCMRAEYIGTPWVFPTKITENASVSFLTLQ